MLFGDKLRQLRTLKDLTQTQAATFLGIPFRTYQNYESCKVYPRQSEFHQKAADFFKVTLDYLLSDEDQYILEAAKKDGSKSKREVQTLLAEFGGLFAGGDLSEEDKDAVMMTLNELYWKAKQNNKKYALNKYRGTNNGANRE